MSSDGPRKVVTRSIRKDHQVWCPIEMNNGKTKTTSSSSVKDRNKRAERALICNAAVQFQNHREEIQMIHIYRLLHCVF
jgi:hypothetical protein